MGRGDICVVNRLYCVHTLSYTFHSGGARPPGGTPAGAMGPQTIAEKMRGIKSKY